LNNEIKNKQFDEERALYNLKDTLVSNCTFAGHADGESVLKEARNLEVESCDFSLRYPLWHVRKFFLNKVVMDEKTRAALWYDADGIISDCRLNGIKALRECDDVSIKNTIVDSPEFGWKCRNISVEDSLLNSEYVFLDAKNIKLNNVKMSGKYSFQYIENLEVTNSELNTKDAFWHTKNVTVKDSVVNGEYLGWYSENLTFINCRISGTQPLCYCKNLNLINCTMDESCDLAFEYSDVNAEIKGSVTSIKNPKSGKIVVDGVGEIIREDAVMECNGEVVVKNI